MLGNEIHDYKAQKAMQEYGNEHLNLKEKLLLKSVLKCGKAVVTMNHLAAVALVRNDKTAKYVGLKSCKSSWCCPVCSAHQMSRYAAKIACAIDALKKQGLSAAMITFTIPHTRGFSCEQATEILYKTWKAFVVHGNKVGGTCKNDIFANFMQAFNSKHRVRCAEYTWGKNGWHPHFHCLFWFPTNRINEILEWEERLNERWLELCKRYTIKEFLIGYPETQRKTVRAQVETRFNIMYSKLNDVSQGVYISKKNNKVIVQQSSDYLCGWGGNKEITGNVQDKATKPGHYTWQQILNNAIESTKAAERVANAAEPVKSLSAAALSDDSNNPAPKESSFIITKINEDNSILRTTDRNGGKLQMKLNELQPAEGSRKKEVRVDAETAPDWWKLFFEYATATRRARHARINFSVHSGLCQIIAAYKKTEEYKTVLKKNTTSQRETFGRWRTVCWFTVAQWKSIYDNDLKIRILILATANDALEKITELLANYQIPPPIINEAEAEKLEAILNAA